MALLGLEWNCWILLLPRVTALPAAQNGVQKAHERLVRGLLGLDVGGGGVVDGGRALGAVRALSQYNRVALGKHEAGFKLRACSAGIRRYAR